MDDSEVEGIVGGTSRSEDAVEEFGKLSRQRLSAKEIGNSE